MKVNWRNAGLLLLIWLVLGVFGIYLTLVSSQFRNAGYQTIDGGKIVSHLVTTSTCSGNPCYDSYAVLGYGHNLVEECTIVVDTGVSNATVARMQAESKFPTNSTLTAYRRNESDNCRLDKRSDTTAIIGVVLLSVAGLILVSLPFCGRVLLYSVIAEDDGVKVHSAEMMSLTPKELGAMRQAQSIAAARKLSVNAARQNAPELNKKLAQHLATLTGMGSPVPATDDSTPTSGGWASINPKIEA